MNTAAPEWMLRGELGLCPCTSIGRRRRGGFLQKTMNAGAGVLRQALFSEDVAAHSGLLQRIDARVKILSVLALLVVTGLMHTLPVLIGLYALTLVLAAGSGLTVRFFVKRVWLFVPIFTGIVVLPATLSVITPGDVVWTLWHWNGQPHGFTEQGLHAAATIITRVATSVSFAVLLTLTTPWARLLAGLRALGVPRVFVLVTGMAYRYLFLLINTVTDMYTARQARTVAGKQSSRAGRRVVSAGVGTLFGKAHQLSEEVHQAMTARGYRGNPRTLQRSRFGPGELAATLVTLAVGVIGLMADRSIR